MKAYIKNNKTGAKIEMSLNRNADAAVALGGCGFIIFILCVLGPVLGAFVIPYDINTLLQWAGKEPTFLWWYGALLGLIPSVSYWATIAAVVIFIVSFFM